MKKEMQDDKFINVRCDYVRKWYWVHRRYFNLQTNEAKGVNHMVHYWAAFDILVGVLLCTAISSFVLGTWMFSEAVMVFPVVYMLSHRIVANSYFRKGHRAYLESQAETNDVLRNFFESLRRQAKQQDIDTDDDGDEHSPPRPYH